MKVNKINSTRAIFIAIQLFLIWKIITINQNPDLVQTLARVNINLLHCIIFGLISAFFLILTWYSKTFKWGAIGMTLTIIMTIFLYLKF